MTSVSTLKVFFQKYEWHFVDLLLPKTKPASVRIVYRPPKCTKLFAEVLNSVEILENEIS